MKSYMTIEIVRALKGCPISVLIAILLAREPVSEKWICTMTGYTDKPVSTALMLLKEYGYVMKLNRYSWMISENIPLNIGSRNNSDSIVTTTTTAYVGEIDLREGSSSKLCGSRNNSDSSKPYEGKRNSILEELNRCGIKGKKAIEISEKTHCDIDYVRGHIRDGKRKGDSLGLTIHKMLSGDPNPDDHGKDKRYAYINGEYAELIEH